MSRTANAALFAVIGTNYGNGSTTFHLPDLRGFDGGIGRDSNAKPIVGIVLFRAGNGVSLSEAESVTNLIQTGLVKTKYSF